jgi:hypothetical protein
MNRSRSSVALVGVLALLLGGGCGGQPDDAPAPARQVAPGPSAHLPEAAADRPEPQGSSAAAAGASDRDLEQLRLQIALLHRDVAEIRLQLARPSSAARQIEAVPDPRVDPEARAQVEQLRLLRVARIESTFRREEYDARWSQGANASVRAALAEVDESLRNQVRSVECRSQSCRVEIASGASGPLGQSLHLILGRLTTTLPNVTAAQVDQGNGEQATVLYLAR